MEPPINTINNVWKELIKLQYCNGSILKLKALQEGEVSETELFNIIEDFKQHKLLQYVPLGSTDCTFYVLVPNDIETAFPYLGITINHENLDYEYKKIFLETAKRTLGELALAPALRPGEIVQQTLNHDALLHANSTISQEYRNHKSEVLTSTTPEISEYDRNSEGIKEIQIGYTKEDGKKVQFIIPFTTIWINNHQEDSWKEIKEVAIQIVDSFLQENEFHLDHSEYRLKTICCLDQEGERRITIKDLNALTGLSLEELLLEKEL